MPPRNTNFAHHFRAVAIRADEPTRPAALENFDCSVSWSFRPKMVNQLRLIGHAAGGRLTRRSERIVFPGSARQRPHEAVVFSWFERPKRVFMRATLSWQLYFVSMLAIIAASLRNHIRWNSRTTARRADAGSAQVADPTPVEHEATAIESILRSKIGSAR